MGTFVYMNVYIVKVELQIVLSFFFFKDINNFKCCDAAVWDTILLYINTSGARFTKLSNDKYLS